MIKNIYIADMQVRINRYLSQCGVMSRRAADDAIASGRVLVNGHRAALGENITPEEDEIRLDGKPLHQNRKYYLAAYKPKYMITTMKDPEGRECVNDIIPEKYKGVFPVGRLDFDAEGLLILTNDGLLANAIHHPTHNMGKVYIVDLKPEASAAALRKMSEGVEIEGIVTRQALVERLKDEKDMTTVRITLRQGLKNQIKKMAEALGLSVVSIRRIEVGPVSLGKLKPREIRELSDLEVRALQNILKKQKFT
jgi:23S rRNA pseudouridine2605 synthase